MFAPSLHSLDFFTYLPKPLPISEPCGEPRALLGRTETVRSHIQVCMPAQFCTSSQSPSQCPARTTPVRVETCSLMSSLQLQEELGSFKKKKGMLLLLYHNMFFKIAVFWRILKQQENPKTFGQHCMTRWDRWELSPRWDTNVHQLRMYTVSVRFPVMPRTSGAVPLNNIPVKHSREWGLPQKQFPQTEDVEGFLALVALSMLLTTDKTCSCKIIMQLRLVLLPILAANLAHSLPTALTRSAKVMRRLRVRRDGNQLS